MDYERCVVPLGEAITAVALARRLLGCAQLSELKTTIVFSRLKRAVSTYFHYHRFSPLLRRPSKDSAKKQSRTTTIRKSPLRSVTPNTVLNLDLSHMSTNDSELRLETERVKRMSNYCLHLERKALWAEARTERENRQISAKREDRTRLILAQNLDLSFKQAVNEQKERKRVEARLQKDEEWAIKRELAAKQRAEAQERTRDDLQRSADKLSLSVFTRTKAAATKRRDLAARSQDRKEFARARKAMQSPSDYAHKVTTDLQFQLKQALSKNQEIVRRILDAGFIAA